MKNLLLLSALVLTFASCKKNNNSSPQAAASNTITATVGTTSETFSNAVAISATKTDTSNYTLAISAVRGANTSQEDLEIAISSINPIVKGSYVFSSSATTVPFIAYYKVLTSSSGADFGTDPSGVNASTVTITSISSTNVQGTFSGVLVSESGDNSTQTITSGKFNVNITSQK